MMQAHDHKLWIPLLSCKMVKAQLNAQAVL